MDKKLLNKELFTKREDAYINSHTHSNPAALQKIVEWLNPSSEQTVLDIATGGGQVAKTLAPFAKQVIATDLTPSMLVNVKNSLNETNNILLLIADAEELPFLDDSMDIATCRIAAHHFPHPEKFIQEAYRVLKPGGKCLFIDNIASEDEAEDQFLNQLEAMRDPSHERAKKISEWKKLFSKQQFTLLQEDIRIKELPFQDWLNRTVDSEEVRQQVTHFIETADEKLQKSIRLQKDENSLLSFAIDEWMSMWEK
ncbi:class I SAM-dependent methyltransferase [Oceanobacillus jeddahense]|uniref:Class I SAM-dependent methyltransferase n=1 Tax=Oceanobacillus jeddahense TaxID=1462527 RepID=A0ABY5JSL8_9BACI|nr:class I SAM-dependent methyltransferase [Oceanobacillus jeddahense]UUI01599.1 class I SAM-dependent methyltransferase [Oceanobacillus jeddahense]